MGPIKVFIADSQHLILAGLKSILFSNTDFSVVGEAESGIELLEKVKLTNADILIIDFTSENFELDQLKQINLKFPSIKILAITPIYSKSVIQGAIKVGVRSYLLKTCDSLEIYEAIYATAKGEKFYCSKVLDVILNENESGSFKSASVNCEGSSISERESEIIALIAEGFSNKEIADKLFLSPHTVNTHRKNIMAKIGVNNAAGIVLYAVKQNLISPNKFLFSSAV